MDWIRILQEVTFRTSRSSGAGGQHVNKTETKVEVVLELNSSLGISAEEKEIIFRKLAVRISDEGLLAVSSQKSRSQLDNKEDALEKLNLLLLKALTPSIKRIRTKPGKASIEERLTEKKIQAEKKLARKRPEL
jgi:ribosome-associated protein